MTDPPSTIDRLDGWIDEKWEFLRGRAAVDRLYYTASEVADFSLVWHTAGVVFAIIEDDPSVAIGLSAVLGVESALVNGPIKSMFNRSRPVQEVDRPHNLRQPRTSSFPSGHASAAIVAAALLSRHAGGSVWYGAAAVVATSRIHVRIHHASDVIGGLAVGGLLGATARRLLG